MGCRNAHIAHYKVRTGKDPGIDALQDKAVFPGIVPCDQEGVVDIAVSEFPDLHNPIPGAELSGDTEKVFHCLASS
jgi:hypothetical protein